MNQPSGAQQINVELGEKESEGIYSNLVLISHSPAEFFMDFTRMVPGIPKTKVYARIIMTPQHAKSFLKAMNDNISKFEKDFGEIPLLGGDQTREFGFKPPAPDKKNAPHTP